MERPVALDLDLQERLERLLRRYRVPYGAIVALEPATGRILALAEYSHERPEARGLVYKPLFPAASVFKIVSAAALLSKGVSSEERVCYHGGRRRLSPALLLDDPRRDGRCATLGEALAHSTNVVFAKLSAEYLEASELLDWAERFGFNSPWALDVPLEVSSILVPEERFEMAKSAAGFGETFLSPLHGAMLAACLANGGTMVSPRLFEASAATERRVLSPELAERLTQMLEATVRKGTARPWFFEKGRFALGKTRVAGKTGTLAEGKPFRDHSWFVGWAPVEAPTIAVAAVVTNGPRWRVRAPYLAREAIRFYLDGLRLAERERAAQRPAPSGALPAVPGQASSRPP